MGPIHVFTGNGKGKTTAALGLAMNRAAAGKTVEIIQFQKGTGFSGEIFALQKLFPQVSITSFGWGCLLSSLIKSGQAKCTACGQCFRKNKDPETTMAPQAFAYAQERLQAGESHVFLLDEISHVINNGLVTLEEVLGLLDKGDAETEVILTGRGMPQELIERASWATELFPRRHPMEQGIASRRGIEY